jgi:hypothetical protein
MGISVLPSPSVDPAGTLPLSLIRMVGAHRSDADFRECSPRGSGYGCGTHLWRYLHVSSVVGVLSPSQLSHIPRTLSGLKPELTPTTELTLVLPRTGITWRMPLRPSPTSSSISSACSPSVPSHCTEGKPGADHPDMAGLTAGLSVWWQRVHEHMDAHVSFVDSMWLTFQVLASAGSAPVVAAGTTALTLSSHLQV